MENIKEESLYPDNKIARNLKNDDISINELLFENVKFDYLNLDERILKGLARAGFSKLSSIQKESVPLGRIGVDMFLQARSGSGKTCAYTVIALDSLVVSEKAQVLIITPTREIAFQVSHVVKTIGAFISNLKVALVTGGFKVGRDAVDVKSAQIIIGTPGRLLQLIELGYIQTNSIRLLILDEADKLFDEQMREQMAALYARLPNDKQVIAVSATFPDSLKVHINKYLKDPQMISIDDDVQFPSRNIQFYALIPNRHNYARKIGILRNWIDHLAFNQLIIFVNTKESGQKIADEFKHLNYRCTYLFGDLAQSERYEIFKKFHGLKFNMLVTTDLFSRGVDCHNVNMVINFDLPESKETFLHRVGRAGRFGVDCLTLTLIDEGQEEKIYKKYSDELGFERNAMPDDLVKDNPWAVLDERLKNIELTDWQKIDRMINRARFLPPCKKYRPLSPPPDFSDSEESEPKVENSDHPRRPSWMKKRGIRMVKVKRPETDDIREIEKYYAINGVGPVEYWSSTSDEEDPIAPPEGWPGCCGGHIMPGTNRWFSLDEDGQPIKYAFNRID